VTSSVMNNALKNDLLFTITEQNEYSQSDQHNVTSRTESCSLNIMTEADFLSHIHRCLRKKGQKKRHVLFGCSRLSGLEQRIRQTELTVGWQRQARLSNSSVICRSVQAQSKKKKKKH